MTLSDLSLSADFFYSKHKNMSYRVIVVWCIYREFRQRVCLSVCYCDISALSAIEMRCIILRYTNFLFYSILFCLSVIVMLVPVQCAEAY